MRKAKIYALSLVMGISFFGSACAFASGYPFAVLSNSSSGNIVVVGKFASGSGQFTLAEADNLAVSVAGLVQSLLGSSSVATPTVLTPNQLTAAGLGDADTVVNLVKANYIAWKYNFYAVVNISKVPQYAAGYGPNIRLDVYVADMASLVGVAAAYLYAMSIEVPYMFTTLLNSLQ